jgi:hypothetical protein
VSRFCPQKWEIALNVEYWSKLPWTKPLLIWLPPSLFCKLGEKRHEMEAERRVQENASVSKHAFRPPSPAQSAERQRSAVVPPACGILKRRSCLYGRGSVLVPEALKKQGVRTLWRMSNILLYSNRECRYGMHGEGRIHLSNLNSILSALEAVPI